jgi:hypothetical protein
VGEGRAADESGRDAPAVMVQPADRVDPNDEAAIGGLNVFGSSLRRSCPDPAGGLGILWVAISLVAAALPMHAGADDLLYSCFTGGSTDPISCGFYIESFSGQTLNTLALSYSTTGQPGTYTVNITAHQGTYDGPVLGSAQTGFDQTGAMSYLDFQNAPVPSATTIAFVQTLISGPPDGLVFFGAGPCAPGDTGCTGCSRIFETEDTTPPLSTFRRGGVQLAIWGLALTPVAPESWGGMKSRYR